MAEQANVTSVEALEAFRAVLINYLEKAGQALDEVSEEVSRTRIWVQQTQPVFWDHEIHRRKRILEDAQQRLFSAELSSMRETSSGEQREVHRAREAYREAEAQAQKVKQWSRGFDSQVEVAAKKVDSLRTVITYEMPKAVAFLTQAIRALDAYNSGSRPTLDSPAAPTSEGEAQTPEEPTQP